MKCFHHLLGVVVIGLICTGCSPFLRLTTSPGASGVLLDAQTHSPVHGAKVIVSRLEWGHADSSLQLALTNARPPLVLSSSEGKFFIPAEHGWAFNMMEPLPGPPDGYLVIRRDGYESDMIPICTNGIANVGSVLLKPIVK